MGILQKIQIDCYNKISVNGRVNGLEIYEVSGKENVLHVSRIEGI